MIGMSAERSIPSVKLQQYTCQLFSVKYHTRKLLVTLVDWHFLSLFLWWKKGNFKGKKRKFFGKSVARIKSYKFHSLALSLPFLFWQRLQLLNQVWINSNCLFYFSLSEVVNWKIFLPSSFFLLSLQTTHFVCLFCMRLNQTILCYMNE